MEKEYRITIFTTKEVIERDFYKKEIALMAIIEFKKWKK